jgi:hypothetical protein
MLLKYVNNYQIIEMQIIIAKINSYFWRKFLKTILYETDFFSVTYTYIDFLQ